MSLLSNKKVYRDGGMAQEVKALTTKANSLGSIPEPTGQEDKQPLQAVF